MPNALVLAAGLGVRLTPLTRLVAKPAVPLGAQPLIERILRWLAGQHVVQVAINLHHRPASLTGIVGDGRHLGLTVRYSWERPLLGSAGGPRHALPLLDSDPFLIVNGDTLCAFDLAPMVRAHRTSGADVTMAVVPNPSPHRYGGLQLDGDCVTGFVPRGHTGSNWHFVGVQVAAARVFADLPDNVPGETVSGIYRDMLAHTPGRVRAWRAPAGGLDVGTPLDYLNAALAYEHVEPGSTRQGSIAASARLTRTVVWPDAVVGPDVVLDRTIVAGPVRVPAGFEAAGAVLVPAALTRPDDHVPVRDGVAIFPLEPAGRK